MALRTVLKQMWGRLNCPGNLPAVIRTAKTFLDFGGLLASWPVHCCSGTFNSTASPNSIRGKMLFERFSRRSQVSKPDENKCPRRGCPSQVGSNKIRAGRRRLLSAVCQPGPVNSFAIQKYSTPITSGNFGSIRRQGPLNNNPVL